MIDLLASERGVERDFYVGDEGNVLHIELLMVVVEVDVDASVVDSNDGCSNKTGER